MRATAPRLEFRILGQLEIAVEGRSIPFASGKLRVLLGLLVLHANELVSTDRLIDELWRGVPPPTAPASLHVYLSKLRKLLAEAGIKDVLQRHPSGYVLMVEREQLDASRFEELVSAGRLARADGDPKTAAARLREGLSLFRGPPFADIADEPFAQVESARLEELRLAALEERIESELSLARHTELVPELQKLVGEQPLRERLRSELMLAQYRSGRQADALRTYRDGHRLLAEQLGVEPGPELKQLETAILEHDPALAPPDVVRGSRLSGRRRRGLATAVALLVVVVIVGILAVALGPTDTGSISKSSAFRTPLIDATITVDLPSCCGFGFDSVWAVGHHDRTVSRIDRTTNQVMSRIRGVGYQAAVPLVAAGSLWVPSAAEDLVRIDPTTERIVGKIPIHATDLAFGFLTLWATTRDHRVIRVDLETNRVVASIRTAAGANDWDDQIAIGYGSVWVSVADEGTLLRIDPIRDRVVGRVVGFGESYSAMPIAVGEGAVWVLRVVGDTEMLFRVDPGTERIVARIPVSTRLESELGGTVAIGAGSVWTGNWDPSISRVDPQTNTVVATYWLDDPPQNVTFGYGALWVDAYEASKVWRIKPER